VGPCTDPVANFTTVAFTSAGDAFPGDVPRPLQPNLNLRSFTLTTPTLATHVQLRVLSNQCTGQAKFAGDQDDDPFNNSDCPASASGAIVRASEIEVFAPVAAEADLRLVKAGPATGHVGQEMTYILTVTNNGPATANGVVVTDTLPKNTGFGSASSTQGTCTPKPHSRLVECSVGSMANSATVTITLLVKPTQKGTYVNTATVSATSPTDPNTANNTSSCSTAVTP